MSRILFLNQPAMGHFNPLLSIALQMRGDGHEVRFLMPGLERSAFAPPAARGAASIPAIVRSQKIPLALIPPAVSMLLPALRLPFAAGYDELALSMDMFSRGITSYTKQVLRVIERIKPDILVADFAFFAAHIAADVLDIPWVAIYHSGLPFRGKLVPPFGSGLPIGERNPANWETYEQKEQILLNQLDHRIKRARAQHGLPPLPPGVMRYPYSRWLNLATTVEAIEVPRDNLGDRTLYIGPCISKRRNLKSDFPFEKLQSGCYKIYVSLGTVFNNKPRVFQMIASALSSPGYQLIISAGKAFKALTRQSLPENVLLFPSVPQVDLLPRVDLVIGHGGNNSTNETLAAGKPLIVIPVGGEQGDNASRIEYLGAGRRLDLTALSERVIREAVEQLRTNPAYQEKTLLLKQAIDLTDGPRAASERIGWIAHHRQPICRSEDSPLTITRSQTLGGHEADAHG